MLKVCSSSSSKSLIALVLVAGVGIGQYKIADVKTIVVAMGPLEHSARGALAHATLACVRAPRAPRSKTSIATRSSSHRQTQYCPMPKPTASNSANKDIENENDGALSTHRLTTSTARSIAGTDHRQG